MSAMLTTKEIAQELDTDPGTVRRYLRTTLPDHKPEKGNRWSINEDEFQALKAKFLKLHASQSNHDTLEMIKILRKGLDELETRIAKGE